MREPVRYLKAVAGVSRARGSVRWYSPRNQYKCGRKSGVCLSGGESKYSLVDHGLRPVRGRSVPDNALPGAFSTRFLGPDTGASRGWTASVWGAVRVSSAVTRAVSVTRVVGSDTF